MCLRKIDHYANYRVFPILRRMYASLERRWERDKTGDLLASQAKRRSFNHALKKFCFRPPKPEEKKTPRNTSFE